MSCSRLSERKTGNEVISVPSFELIGSLLKSCRALVPEI
jgi:hypothetical protein